MFFSHDDLHPLMERLKLASAEHDRIYPGPTAERQPVHVVYGGAHLFKAGTPARLGSIALDTLRKYVPSPAGLAGFIGLAPSLSETIYSRVIQKLEHEPVEDYHIDFEDGYGYRPDAEEDAHAVAAARELAAGIGKPCFPPFCGFRVKPLTEALRVRAMRTFQLFMGALLEATGGVLPPGFVVTLPKVTSSAQVAVFADLLEMYESRAGLERGSLRMEMMIETVQSIIAPDGRAAIPEFLRAARGRCRTMHFGAYDYTSDCNITAKHQSMSHPACMHARHVMQVCLAGTGVMMSDSLTSLMPVAIHKGANLTDQQAEENRLSVRQAWRQHYSDTRNSLSNGFYQGWDVHPAQFVPRYAAVYEFFLESLAPASARLKNFMAKAAQATTAGSTFDDAATAQGLLNFFLLGMNCGAITETEVLATGLTLEELRSRSFAAIMKGRVHATHPSAESAENIRTSVK
jgi:citrate lyase beta subunit